MKTINGFSYDYSNLKPIHKFINEDKEISIFREQYGYALLQKSSTGQQRLKLDEVQLSSFLINLTKNKWKEVNANF
jgi:hypothetical protein